MGKNIILHDRRLAGSAPIGRGITTIRLDGSTSLTQAFSAITTLVRLDGVQNLYILCHGYAGESSRGQVCGDMGGEGLELGREGLTHTNVARWSFLRGCLETIVVHSCGAADTQPENVGTNADGKYLMGALAMYTNSTVYAGDRIQWYTGSTGTIDFGSWEGTLWKFAPSGSFSAAPGNRVPLELLQV
jgi:hypothetical protein